MKLKVLRKQNNSKECVVCGTHNHASLGASIYEVEGGLVVGLITGKEIHQSYPHRMHGGIATALLDEIIGRAINVHEPETFGVTGALEIKFKKPVPLNEEIKVVGKITRNTSRLFEAEGFIEDSAGNILDIAHATYIKQPVTTIAGEEFSDEDWFLIPDEVEYIDVKNVNFFDTLHFVK